MWLCFFQFLMIMFSSTVVLKIVQCSVSMMHVFPTRIVVCMMYALLARLLAGGVEKLAGFWHIGTPSWTIGMLARFLALKHVKMTSWHALCTWALGHVDHAGTYGTRFSKFVLPNTSLLLCTKFEQVSSITRNNLFRNLTCVQNQKLKLLNSIWNLFQGAQTKKSPQIHWHRSGVFILNFEHI